MRVNGRQIKDDSLEGIDIKDETIEFVDLSPNVKSFIYANRKNTMINSTEIRALKKQDLDPDLSIFVDSFDDDSSLDISSFNYEIDQVEGAIQLIQGGVLSSKDSTISEFDLGTYSGTESFLDIGGDGAIRKERLVSGGTEILEDFEDGISNVSVSSNNDPSIGIISVTNSSDEVYSGSKSLKWNVNFSNKDNDDSSQIDIVFDSPQDISLRETIRCLLKHKGSGKFNYIVKVTDSSLVSYSTSLQQIFSNEQWNQLDIPVSSISGVDKTQITTFSVEVFEDISLQTVFDLSTTGAGSYDTIVSSRDPKQTFQVVASRIVQRVRLRIRTRNNPPRVPLFVGLANMFETTLAVAILDPADVTGGWGTIQDVYATFDNKVTLIPGQQYSLLLKTYEDSWNYAWDYNVEDIDYEEGTYFLYGNPQKDSIMLSLYEPAVNDSILVDQIEVESESQYNPTAEYLSAPINLGLTPSSFDTIGWTEFGSGTDIIQIRIKSSISEEGLATSPWSSFFDSGEDISGVAVSGQWLQYQVVFQIGDNLSTKNISEIIIQYLTSPGQGNAIVVSKQENTEENPSSFIMLWDSQPNTGTITFYVSRDGKATWQNVLESEEGENVEFINSPGSQVHMKAIITGDAKLYSWSLGCNKEFI